MKKAKQYPLKTFKALLKGSTAATLSGIIIITLSLVYVFKMRNELVYCRPLIIGSTLLIWHMISNLLMYNVIKKNQPLKIQFEAYKRSFIKREQYENIIYTLWFLTFLPAYSFGIDITLFILLKWVAFISFVLIFGNLSFKKTNKYLLEIEQYFETPTTTF